MSRFITPPDFDYRADAIKILLVNAPVYDVELITLVVKMVAGEYDVYLYKDEFNDNEWLAEVEKNVDHTFTWPKNNANDVVNLLQK